ncbi:hypothetical protein [Streptomyces sp. NBC_00083]|uniref:hypothetical protein n=1 Tax=Streptomyces sp. NBC_00083 TaxID=2975647 RepID=UPI00225A94FB|nr:hypothetical protein [Streptomyces sp. NBC_00083]MCX5388143.1 hypothetical protein [Streptomyces sp. NBC_00083]
MNKLTTVLVAAALFAGVSPAAAHAVDVNQEYNSAGCYLGKKDPKACERLLATKPMSKTAKDCLVKAGIGGIAALVVGRVNKDIAKKIATNVVAAGATGCLSSLA